ncbi:DCA1 [Auxenochlorella protothecoides x Auxenochlorella symbiontica]
MCVAALPCPAFEGSEKRISVSFSSRAGAVGAGLRALTRAELDALMDSAACLIVSARHHASHDAYVLSESSCFVYPDRIVVKTCGTTRLLACVPLLLRLAAGLGLEPAAVKYSRASFLFPAAQPEEHASFEAETAALRAAFAALPLASAYVLGDALAGLQWHVFAAGVARGAAAVAQAPPPPPLHTLELCMTGLCPRKAANFFRTEAFVDSRRVTCDSGIQDLLPKAEIDDYVFEPCGYSMNAVEAGSFSTIHITPEDGFSYASFELCGYDPATMDVPDLVARVAAVFRPRHMAVALSVDAPAGACVGDVDGATWRARRSLPAGYACHAGSFQELRAGGHVAFFGLDLEEGEAFDGQAEDLPHAAGEALGAAGQLQADCAAEAMELALEATAGVLGGHAVAACDAGAGSSDGGSPRGVVSRDPLSSVLTDLDSLGEGAGEWGGGRATPSSTASEDARPVGPRPLGEVLALHGAHPLPDGSRASLDAHAAALIASRGLEDTFYVIDLGLLARLALDWRAALPRVAPCYAVKALPDAAVLATLAALGARFDCASEAELRAVRALGVPASRTLLANACKRPRDLRAGAELGCPLTTFDSVDELRKVARAWPGARLLLRVRADAPAARCPLGNKYGAEAWEWAALAAEAARLGLPVDGVAFHVGSGAGADAAGAYENAIAVAADAAEVLRAAGHAVSILDIGGGFPGGALGGIAPAINAALEARFPGVEVVAEPGRFFAERIATLATAVFGARERSAGGDARDVGAIATPTVEDPTPHPTTRELFVTDGIYGSMNCMLYDHASPLPRALATDDRARGGLVPTTVFGPTCDGLDTLVRGHPLPAGLGVGSWLVWPDMGAYTICGASAFNGMDAVNVPRFYVWSVKP